MHADDTGVLGSCDPFGSQKKHGSSLMFRLCFSSISGISPKIGIFWFWRSENAPLVTFDDQQCRFPAGKCAVCVCGECHVMSNDVLMDVFCAVSVSGTMRSLRITFQKSRLWRQRKPSACGTMMCPFSHTSNGCLFTPYDTRGSQVPAILRDWQELDAEQAVS